MAGFLDYCDTNSNINAGSCNFNDHYNETYDGFAYGSNFRSGDIIKSLQICELDDNGIIIKRMVNTVGISDGDWVQFATSCEKLTPGDDTIMIIERRQTI